MNLLGTNQNIGILELSNIQIFLFPEDQVEYWKFQHFQEILEYWNTLICNIFIEKNGILEYFTSPILQCFQRFPVFQYPKIRYWGSNRVHHMFM